MNESDRRHPSDGFDADAIFADIVAHLDDVAVEPERAEMPRAEDVSTDDEAAGPADDGADKSADDGADHQPPGEGWLPGHQPPALPQPDNPQALPTPQVWRAHDLDDEHEEHFEPPPVAPLPVGDLQFWGILVGMAGGPLLLLYLVLFNRDAGSHWILTSIALSVGGFALLVLRLPRDREDDDDGVRL